MLTVGQLKKLLADSELPDDAPVVIDSRYGFHECDGEPTFIKEFDGLGQVEYNVAQEKIGPNAFRLKDTWKG